MVVDSSFLTGSYPGRKPFLMVGGRMSRKSVKPVVFTDLSENGCAVRPVVTSGRCVRCHDMAGIAGVTGRPTRGA